MRTADKIKELERKIEKRSSALLHNIKSQIEKKYKDLCASTDQCLKQEKQCLKKRSDRLVKKMEAKAGEQSEKIAKMKRRIEGINEMLKKLEHKSISERIKKIKADVGKMVEQQNERYEKIRSDQKKVYRAEFERLKGRGEEIVGSCADKVKGMLE